MQQILDCAGRFNKKDCQTFTTAHDRHDRGVRAKLFLIVASLTLCCCLLLVLLFIEIRKIMKNMQSYGLLLVILVHNRLLSLKIVDTLREDKAGHKASSDT